MNIFEQIIYHGSDGDFEPPHDCEPTECPRGSKERIETMAQRVLRSQPIFHKDDGMGETR